MNDLSFIHISSTEGFEQLVGNTDKTPSLRHVYITFMPLGVPDETFVELALT